MINYFNRLTGGGGIIVELAGKQQQLSLSLSVRKN